MGGAASRRLGRFVIVQEPTKGLVRPKAELRLGAGGVLGSCCAWGAGMEPQRFGAGRACEVGLKKGLIWFRKEFFFAAWEQMCCELGKP